MRQHVLLDALAPTRQIRAVIKPPSPSVPCLRYAKNRLAFAMAILALVVQALVPAGFMVSSQGQDKLFAITLCTSSGDVAAFMQQDGSIVEAPTPTDSPSDNEHDGKTLCAFVGHGAAVIESAVAQLDPPAFATQSAQTTLGAYSAPGIGLAAPPPPKTGPPRQA